MFVENKTAVLPHEINRQWLQSTQPDTLYLGSAGGGLEPTATSSGTTPAMTTEGATETPDTRYQTLPDIDTRGLFETGKGIVRGFQEPMQAEAQLTSQQLANLGEQFRTEAGPERTWEDIGGQATMERAVSAETPEAERAGLLESAGGLLGAQYTGPSGLDAQESTRLGERAADIAEVHRRLGTGEGLQASLRTARPGMTTGEAQWEAKRVYGTPEYRQAFRTGDTGAIGEAQKRYATETAGAAEYAGRRATQEKDIASSARSSLYGMRDAINAEIDKRSQETLAANDAAVAAWNEWKTTGDISDRSVLGTYENPYEAKQQEAIAKLNEIWQKYPEIADIANPGRVLNVGEGGTKYETTAAPYRRGTGESPSYTAVAPEYSPLGWTDEAKQVYYASPRPRETPGELNAPYYIWRNPTTGEMHSIPSTDWKQLIARQSELEKYFAPYDVAGGEIDYGNAEYADVLPMYYGETYEPTDIVTGGDWLTFQPGSQLYTTDPETGAIALSEATELAPEYVATEGERYSLNTISELLGEAQRIGEAEPFQAAQIVLNLDSYLANEKNKIDAAGTEADTEAKAYWQGASKAQKDLRKYLNQNAGVKAAVNVLKG